MVASFSLTRNQGIQKYLLPFVVIDANKKSIHNVATEKMIGETW